MGGARITGALSATVLAAAASTSCSADAGSQGAPTFTATITASTATPPPTTDATPEPPSATPPVEEPSMPPAARAPGRAGAEAFVRYYIDLVNYSGLTGDIGEMELAASGCVSCKSLAEAFETTYERGGAYRTEGWRIQSQFTLRQPDGEWASLLKVNQAPMVWVKAAAAEPQRFEAKQLNLRVALKRQEDEWKIADFTQ